MTIETNEPPFGSGERFLREPEVLKLVGVSKVTLRRWEEAGLFPKRYKLGPHSVAWKESEVLAWIANRPHAIDDETE